MDPDNPQKTDVTIVLKGVTAKAAAGAPTVTVHGALPADHPFYAYVGRIASEWSHLEHLLDATIWDLLPVNKVMAACVTSQIMGVGPRCNAINTLGKLRGIPDPILKPFRTLKQNSYSVGDWRNRFIHDPWYFEIVSGAPAQFRAMPVVDPRFGFQEIELSEIEQTIAKIKELQDHARTARDSIVAAVVAMPQGVD